MTQEEKLEKAKELYPTANADQRYVLECLFPELVESEDERIRKALIKFHKSTIDIDGIKGEQIIAWLEKQSNTIPDECVFRPVAGCNIESAAKQAIKQQGVLAKKIVLAFNGAYIPVGGKAADIIVNEYNSWLEKQGQKPQRMVSAEAKEALYDKPATIDIDKMVDNYADNEEFGKPLNCMIRAYRQGLKDAIGKVVSESAWSEEDEEMLGGIILRCEKYGHQEQINWLKSLKQRHTWKPSDEQMYMLEWLTTNVLDDGVVGNKAKEVLNTLIEQLKSL